MHTRTSTHSAHPPLPTPSSTPNTASTTPTNTAMSAYVSATRVEERVAKCASLNAGASVPVVLESVRGGKAHFSVLPRDATVAQLVAGVRRLDGVDAAKAVSLSVAGCVVAAAATVGELHDACKRADDGMLYVTYTAEQKMGGAVWTPGVCCSWN